MISAQSGGFGAELTVRTAGLDDVAGIHAVHKSDVQQWRRLDGAPGEFDRLSILERYLNGGPWMSPESCAVYINELVLAATPPIVAVRDGRVLGEMELLYGRDWDELGKAVCLSILYVHRDARGQGVGRALVSEAARRGRALGCRSIENTDPEPEAIPFYEREGFRAVRELTTVTIPLQPGSTPGWPGTREITPLAALASVGPETHLVLGRARHPALIRQNLSHGAGPGRLAIPGTGGLVRAFAFTVGQENYTAFFRGVPLRANAHAAAHVFGRVLSEELVDAVTAIASAAGYGSLALTVGADQADLVNAVGPRKSHTIWALYL